MRMIDADQVQALGPVAAAEALVAALRSGLDPAAGPARIGIDLQAGQMLLMPAEVRASTAHPREGGVDATVTVGLNDAVGIKIVNVAPGNPALGLPRIQAAYLLFDAQTLALRAWIDGTALTTLRTPAVTMAAIRDRLPRHALSVAIIGAGPAAMGHARALAAHRPLDRLTFLVRDRPRVSLGTPAGVGTQAVLGTGAAEEALRQADVVICATSAREPLFDSRLLRTEVVVAAVGSHEPSARELDADLMERATVVVEDVDTALREAGDVVMAAAEAALDPASLVPLASVARGQVRLPADRPVVVKTVGMAWEDLVVASACAAFAAAV